MKNRSVISDRVTSRTYFLSNSLFRGRVLCAHRLSAFSHCVSVPCSFRSVLRVLVVIFILGLLSSFLSRTLHNRSYCSRRCLFLSPAMQPHSRSEKPDGIFICGLVHNKTLPFLRGSIPIVKSTRTLFLLQHDWSVSLLLQLRGKMSTRRPSPQWKRKVGKIA